VEEALSRGAFGRTRFDLSRGFWQESRRPIINVVVVDDFYIPLCRGVIPAFGIC